MKNIPFARPNISNKEINEVSKTLRSPILVHGPKIIKFEDEFKKFTKAPYAVSVSSCTAGMHLIYFTLGLGVGDEVLLPSQSHVATAHAIELTGAKPIFIDVDKKTGNINAENIEKFINKKTKAIAVVHFLGIPVDMPKIMKIAKKYKLFVLEDCALSLGGKVNKKHTGLLGDAGVFSFYPVKHITTAEGGMIILKNKKLAEKLKLNKAFGVNRNHSQRKKNLIYDVVSLGFNYRMNEISATMGIEQLKKLPSFLKVRKKNFLLLKKKLENIPNIKVIKNLIKKNESSNYCLSLILLNKLRNRRNDIINKLKKRGIGTSVYYPKAIPEMKYYKKKYNVKNKNFRNASIISNYSISFPVGPHIKENEIAYIVKKFNEIINE